MKHSKKSLVFVICLIAIISILVSIIVYLLLDNYQLNTKTGVVENRSLIIEQEKSAETIKYNNLASLILNTDASKLVKLQNKKRNELGLSGLKINNTLIAAAAAKAEDLFTRDYWAHQLPGESAWQQIANVSYRYSLVGENLATGQPDSESVVRAWINSPEHYENISNSEYNEIGCFSKIYSKFKGKNNTALAVCYYGRQY